MGSGTARATFMPTAMPIRYFQVRISHVLGHVNPNNGKTWADSSEYIFAFEAQNEAMHPQVRIGGHFVSGFWLAIRQGNPSALASWQCTMAETIQNNLDGSGSILVSTGAGSYLNNSLLDPYFACAALDMLAIHAYGVSDFDTSRLQAYVTRATGAGKKLIMQEWGACYTDPRTTAATAGAHLLGASGMATYGTGLQAWTQQGSRGYTGRYYPMLIRTKDGITKLALMTVTGVRCSRLILYESCLCVK